MLKNFRFALVLIVVASVFIVGLLLAALWPRPQPLPIVAPQADWVERHTMGYLYNGTTWDYHRNNVEGTLIATGGYTATQASANQTNYNARGVMVWLDITDVPGTDTVNCELYLVPPVGSDTLKAAETGAQDIAGIFPLLMYPGAIDSNSIYSDTQAGPLPRTWKVGITHSGEGVFTYTVGYSYID